MVRRPGFRFVESSRHHHVGALLADGALQAGLNYRTVVFPRVTRLERLYSSAASMSGLLKTLEEHGAAELLNWTHPEKISRFELLVSFFNGRAETVADIGAYLTSHEARLELTALRGIGAKTGDYLYRLSGGAAIAIDRHVIRFVQDAGITHDGYLETQQIVDATADLLGISRDCFDASIWRFMSNNLGSNSGLGQYRQGELSLA